MRSFPENFECLILGEAHFGVPQIVGYSIIIPVMHLPVHAYGRHPLVLTNDKAFWKHPALGEVVDGLLVFHDVFLSKRSLDEYIGGSPDDPHGIKGFKDAYEIIDIDIDIGLKSKKMGDYPFDEVFKIINVEIDGKSEKMNVYSFEGVLEQPYAWVTWDILARSFELQVD
jgi:hypothetical protein